MIVLAGKWMRNQFIIAALCTLLSMALVSSVLAQGLESKDKEFINGFLKEAVHDSLYIGEFVELNYQKKTAPDIYFRVASNHKYDRRDSIHVHIHQKNPGMQWAANSVARWPKNKTIKIIINHKVDSSEIRTKYEEKLRKEFLGMKGSLEDLTGLKLEMLPEESYTDNYDSLFKKADIVILTDDVKFVEDLRRMSNLPIVKFVPVIRFDYKNLSQPWWPSGALSGGFVFLNSDGNIEKAYCKVPHEKKELNEEGGAMKLCLYQSLGLINFSNSAKSASYLKMLYSDKIHSSMSPEEIKRVVH